MFLKFIYTIIIIYLFGVIMPNVSIGGIFELILFLFIFGILNGIVFPIIKIVSFPINFLTLGLFNAILNLIALFIAVNSIDAINISGSSIEYFFTLVLLSVILTVPSMLVGDN